MTRTNLAADDIFFAARAFEAPERRLKFLDGSCGGDAELRARVEALLLGDAEAGSFLASASQADPDATIPKSAPADDINATIPHTGAQRVTVVAPLSEQAGQVIGRFKLLQQIGEGGFGSVWMAEQREPVVRKVALKIIKLGMDTRQVIARFEAERQALALMDHPNIAKVLDAGATETGRPFFVMELCNGDAITEYCDKNNLAIPERLDLFAQVCQAVQHAHQKGLIHRDIKPSNVLVATQDGRPHAKVIDFGIAKATASRLTEKTLFTEHRQLIGTPQYMSPEQAEGSLDIDTRTDVYSLGVLLYELLTGTTPFDPKSLRSAAYAEIQRIIREVEPPKPSTRLSQNTDTLANVAARRHVEPKKLGTIIRGELDWIVMKALEKDRQRRYETANGLAMDIRRYLAGEAVVAAPPGTAYRFRTFVRRNKGKVTAGAVVAAALVLGMIGTGLALNRALRAESGLRTQLVETEKAQKAEKARADELKQVSDFQGRMLAQVDPTTAGVRLTEDVNRRFAAAMEKAKVPEAERAGLAGEFRKNWSRVNATDAAAALIDETILKPAVKAIDEQFKDQPIVDAQLRHALAERYRALGLYDAALPLQRAALETRRRVLGNEHASTLVSIADTGTLLQQQGRLSEAEPYLLEALALCRRIQGDGSPGELTALNNLGVLLREQGKPVEAEPYMREGLEKSRRLLGEDDPETLKCLNNMGILLQAQGRLVEAEPFYREALEKRRRAMGDDHHLTLNSINNLGALLQAQGKNTEAAPYFRETLERRRRVVGEEHPATIQAVCNMGYLLTMQGKLSEAEPHLLDALEKCRRVLGSDRPQTLQALNNLGALRQAQGRLAEAEMLYRESLKMHRSAFGDEHPETLDALNRVRLVLLSQGKFTEAEPIAREMVEKRRRLLGDEHRHTLDSISNLGMLLQHQGRFAEAEAALGQGLKGCERAFQGPDPQTAMLLHHHADVLRALGRLDDALAEARRADEMYRQHPDWSPPEAAHAASVLATILTEQGKPDEALDALRRLLSLIRTANAPASPNLTGLMANVGQALLKRGTLDAAREAEPLLRECLELRVRIMPDDWRVANAKSLLGGAFLEIANLDEALSPAARVDKLREAEPLILDGNNGLKDNPAVPTPAQVGGDRRHEALERVVRLYETWNKAEPGKGYDAKVAEWTVRLNKQTPASSAPAGTQE